MDATTWNGGYDRDHPSVDDDGRCWWCHSEAEEPCTPLCDCLTCRERRHEIVPIDELEPVPVGRGGR